MVDYTEETENEETENTTTENSETENNPETNEPVPVETVTSDDKSEEIPKPGETGKKPLKKYR